MRVQIASTVPKYGFSELKSPREKQEKYVKVIAKMIDYLTERINGVAGLVPNQFGPRRKDDDRAINQVVYQRVMNKHRVKLIRNEYTPEELKRIIGQFDLLISGRIHPIIHAFFMGVPSVGIDYATQDVNERLAVANVAEHQ